jgi:hypothetical protein
MPAETRGSVYKTRGGYGIVMQSVSQPADSKRPQPRSASADTSKFERYPAAEPP